MSYAREVREWKDATRKEKAEAWLRFLSSPGYVLLILTAAFVGCWLAMRR
jgi:hypothetical protein